MNIDEAKQAIHEQVIYPMVRVIAGQGGGSGTVIYSEPDPLSEHDEYETYVLTNHHVVSRLIKVEKKFDPARGIDVKKQVTKKAQVDIFRYRYWSVKDRDYGVDADIVAWDEDRDLALLRLDSVEKVDYVANLYALSDRDIENRRMPNVHVADKVAAVGAAMLNPPVFTEGRVSRMFEEIDNYPYMMTTAPTIFGNSGGALYRRSDDGNSWAMIGVPARIQVNSSGFGWDAITHLSWSIPIFTVYDFLKRSYFDWLFDEDTTKQQCLDRKERDRKRAEIEAVLDAQGNE